MTLRVLEFYSGIGGMHYAAELAEWNHEILKAFDINTVANEIYRHNFGAKLRLIETLSIEYYSDIAADVWTMSPPCQPYTRIGLKQGSQDGRAKSFLHLLDVLKGMKNRPKYILVENVKGFEESDSRDMLVDTLGQCDYAFQEFMLTPLQLGIPNSRMRYYLLAKLKPLTFALNPTNSILGYVPFSAHMSSEFVDSRTRVISNEEQLIERTSVEIEPLSNYLDPLADITPYIVPDKVLAKHSHVFDIVKPDSRRRYSHYAEATGSVLQMNTDADAAIAKANGETENQLDLLHTLQLRYFAPREVANLMGFPKSFTFPDTSSLKQRYRTLGNSINVRLVSELMRYLLKENTTV
ncbi:hypothetical protein PHYBLDRAFT_146309 [Phycomyces blakesleeanus NRRL 1555(-)]|uniref:tRNA (cytosine(38)-C(5))-methyltransferase n=1 Tax=Phycomyces blakesleeanus (strain ATCC 8743b / DSM 1359 / FGSC 10004 / NBRC 33097 / NRRL 1555) TaxID=763407 RepID=A0A167MJC4_PHYB8|nr:hypothetical protein PHYBLDRAFT_146309 [Phycomyces blakesleeanus NRRL 1555(-)]OAD72996.1 hypothetical protein PHYBLDRAFT_146309 [Phycomyces blakesleeanus NRRL 1555(-)]|eukprot:XP_018291036.1 hypothetical protein PHYBLDRAFT_146309 [Phycomyces blakesleeanus NRRL 1555(-)]